MSSKNDIQTPQMLKLYARQSLHHVVDKLSLHLRMIVQFHLIKNHMYIVIFDLCPMVFILIEVIPRLIQINQMVHTISYLVC